MRGTWSRLRYRIGAVPSLQFASGLWRMRYVGRGHPRNKRARDDSSHVASSHSSTSAVTSAAQPNQARTAPAQPAVFASLFPSGACKRTSPFGLMSLKSSPSTATATILAARTTV